MTPCPVLEGWAGATVGSYIRSGSMGAQWLAVRVSEPRESGRVLYDWIESFESFPSPRSLRGSQVVPRIPVGGPGSFGRQTAAGVVSKVRRSNRAQLDDLGRPVLAKAPVGACGMRRLVNALP